MDQNIGIVGGGIGGMAAALASARAGWHVQLWERSAAFSEIGAGIQIGPNVTRLLHGWGLHDALAAVAAFPHRLQVRDAASAHELGVLPLGAAMQQRYGAPYATIHRADLHALLHAAAAPHSLLRLNTHLHSFNQTEATVHLRSSNADECNADALLGADGLWSAVRQGLLHDGPPRTTGHLAYRALVRQADLPAALRSQQVTAWLGPRLHVVQYPVRSGDWLNVVAFVHGQLPGNALDGWDHSANAADLRQHLSNVCTPLQDLLQAIAHWRLWVLHDRPPMQGPHQHAQGRVALLGDAAHPMRPYLAQGAGMAIEDAAALADALRQATNVPAALAHYAHTRWQRNARVQARAERNGRIFHATGLLRWGRNRAMQWGGAYLMDMPWLYGP